MSASHPTAYTATGRVNHREQSADNELFSVVATLPAPATRQIPLPEFYPRERTSTASFKAPVTSASKRKMELPPPPPPPPPGTLTTAMGYITTPVKYISSIFSAPPPPPPEPPKIKERLFKIDLEREKEKQMSPRISNSVKKIQNLVVEEVGQAPKTPRQVEKNQGSAWRRKNMVDNGMVPPLSPIPAAKSRTQSLRRLTPSNSPSADMTSPLTFNQMKIASSLNQNSFKVMSKMPVAEPEKKKKKDVRKVPHQRPQKEVPVLTSSTKVNSKYQANSPSRLNALPREEYPIFPYPTVIPPRIPPPSYTIRSGSSAKERVQENPAKAFDMYAENDHETNLINSVSTTDTPELVSYPSPTVLKPFFPNGENDSSSVDEKEDMAPHETLGKPDLGDLVKLSRLDKLPAGRLTDLSNLKNVFQDTKLVNESYSNVTIDGVLRNGQVGTIGVVLCSAPGKNPSPVRKEHQSPTKAMVSKRSPTLKDASYSPAKKGAPPPIVIRSQVKEVPPAAAAAEPMRDEPVNRHPSQSAIAEKPRQLLERKASKEIAIKSGHTKSPSPTSKQAQRKVSPLRVDDKYMSVVEEQLSKQQEQRRSRYSTTTRSYGKTSPVNVKPNVITKIVGKGGEKSPEKPNMSSSLNKAIIGAAAVTTAAAAVATALQPAQDAGKADKDSAPIPAEAPVAKENKRQGSPSSWKMHKDKAVATATSTSPPKVEQKVSAAEESASDSKPKRSLSMEARDFIRSKIFKSDKELEANDIKPQDTSNPKSGPPKKQTTDENEGLNCLDNYCGDPAKYFKAATMMGELP
ncbi:hypothetical protein EGW08_017951 [Elysia chlorotica]|uniref:Uncharacterized protein n=1 Tax=Elysia chlorotica TaxID=188477 RepID=A0A433SYB7_ELYCH|nr:hypothetical protein EGW08_017951 [Elysia chlorotica]